MKYKMRMNPLTKPCDTLLEVPQTYNVIYNEMVKRQEEATLKLREARHSRQFINLSDPMARLQKFKDEI